MSLLSPQTLVLVGCFTVFWTIYYLLEAYLSQRSVARRISSYCWPQRNRKAWEEGTELESTPLCNGKGPDGTELGDEGPPSTTILLATDGLTPGNWSRGQSQSRGTWDGALQHLPPDLLQGAEEQMC